MKIGYAGMFKFPDGNAGAFHVLGIGKALREYGHTVIFFGIEDSPQPAQRVSGTVYNDENSSYAGFKYRSSEPRCSNTFGELKRRVSLKAGTSFIRRLEMEELESGPFDAIIVYQPESLWIWRLLAWCRSRKIPLICDVVEWFNWNHMKGGRYGYRALDSEYRMRKGHALTDGIFAISTYLENYYSKRGVPALRIPNLVDISEDKWAQNDKEPEKSGKEKLHLAFVGTAGHKDFLMSAIRGLSILGSERCDIVAVGPSREELRVNLGKDSGLLEKLNKSLIFTDMLPHKNALRLLAQADFSILLRPDEKFANAGFPTKLVESLAMGVPVICNLTSDISLYVKDGREGVVVPDCSPEAFAEGVRRILSMSADERLAIRRHARNRAEESFDYHNWVSPLGEFIDRIAANVRENGSN